MNRGSHFSHLCYNSYPKCMAIEYNIHSKYIYRCTITQYYLNTITTKAKKKPE